LGRTRFTFLHIFECILESFYLDRRGSSVKLLRASFDSRLLGLFIFSKVLGVVCCVRICSVDSRYDMLNGCDCIVVSNSGRIMYSCGVYYNSLCGRSYRIRCVSFFKKRGRKLSFQLLKSQYNRKKRQRKFSIGITTEFNSADYTGGRLDHLTHDTSVILRDGNTETLADRQIKHRRSTTNQIQR
jgi:hypothetical protein